MIPDIRIRLGVLFFKKEQDFYIDFVDWKDQISNAGVKKKPGQNAVQRVPALRVFWDLEKTVLHETRVSGTVLWSPTNANSPTYTYISQKMC